jgi:hypothetical protein
VHHSGGRQPVQAMRQHAAVREEAVDVQRHDGAEVGVGVKATLQHDYVRVELADDVDEVRYRPSPPLHDDQVPAAGREPAVRKRVPYYVDAPVFGLQEYGLFGLQEYGLDLIALDLPLNAPGR